MSDIITLQFGTYANYVCSHYWNCLAIESGLNYPNYRITSDVLFFLSSFFQKLFDGTTEKSNEAFPRTIIVDQKGVLGSLAKGLTTPISKNSCWDSEYQVIRGEQPKKNLFLKYLDANQELYENSNKSQESATKQETKRDNSKMEVEEDNLFPDNNDSQKEINQTKEKEEKEKEELMKLLKNPELCNARGFQLDDNVSVWSDYLNINFDQQTISEIPSINGVDTFDTFDHGVIASHDRIFLDEYEENLRRYAEECDKMPSFLSLIDDTSAFSGTAATCMTLLRDEFPKADVVLFSTEEPFIPSATNFMERSKRALNHSLGIAELAQLSTLYIPLSLTNAKLLPRYWNKTSKYHSSAIYATAINTISLFWRMNTKKNYSLSTFASQFAIRRSSFASTFLSFPCDNNTITSKLIAKQGRTKDGMLLTKIAILETEYRELYSVKNIADSLMNGVSLPFDLPPIAENGMIYGADQTTSDIFKESINTARLRCFGHTRTEKMLVPMTYPQFFTKPEEGIVKECSALTYVTTSTLNLSNVLRHSAIAPYLRRIAEDFKLLWKCTEAFGYDNDAHLMDDVEQTLFEMSDAYQE